MTRPAQVPSCQMDLDEAVRVAEHEPWTMECVTCREQGVHRDPVMIQGGIAGMSAHRATVHPDLFERYGR